MYIEVSKKILAEGLFGGTYLLYETTSKTEHKEENSDPQREKK